MSDLEDAAREEREFLRWMDKLEEMVDAPKFKFAFETLNSIYEWALEKGFLTEKQKRAVLNIEESVER